MRGRSDSSDQCSGDGRRTSLAAFALQVVHRVDGDLVVGVHATCFAGDSGV